MLVNTEDCKYRYGELKRDYDVTVTDNANIFSKRATTAHDDDDEEWGWDDQPTRDVEMSDYKKVKGKEQHPSVPRSRPETNVSPRQQYNLKHRSLSKEKIKPSPGSHNSVGSGGGSVGKPGLSVRGAQPASRMGVPKTSGMGISPATRPQGKSRLGAPKAAVVKKPPPPPPKKAEDDIFAEMGFAAKPTFGRGAPTTSRPTTATSIKAAPKILGAKSLSADDPFASSADWGDDGDLDDLLDD